MSSPATAPPNAPEPALSTSAWRLAVLVVVLVPLTIAMWLLGVAGMRLGLARAGAVMGGVLVTVTWVLYRRRPTLLPALAWAGIVAAAVTLLLWASAPVMPDRLLAAFPAEAVPEAAVHRETRTFGSGLQITATSSAIRWYEVPGDPEQVRAGVRQALEDAGWTIEQSADPLFDFRATNPNATVDAAVKVGVDTPRQRFEAGSTEPLPRHPANTILEIGVGVHH